ncbi:MAG: hypothetical protein PVH41_12110 [Anaerolineae bacterium]|jgi:hypothetical protein
MYTASCSRRGLLQEIPDLTVGRDWVTRHDFCDGPYVPNRSFDMIWACEFVEHVDEAVARNYLETFGFADRYIFMTHALPGQKGWHHVNCQPRAYWITVISEIGFRFSPGLTLAARVKADGHFRNSGLVFVKHGFHLPLGARMGAAVLFPDVVMHLLGKLSRSVADSIARGITPYLQGR